MIDLSESFLLFLYRGFEFSKSFIVKEVYQWDTRKPQRSKNPDFTKWLDNTRESRDNLKNPWLGCGGLGV